MDVPPDALVELTLDPASYTLELEPGATVAGALVRRSDGRSMVRFRQRADWREVELEVDEPSLTLSDAVYLVSVALFTEHHRDAYLMRGGALGFVEPTRRRLSVPHPPRMESVEAMLSELPPRTRIELLVEACELGVPIWTRWASTGKLTYFDGIMAMASVPHDLAEASIRAARRWLEDGDGAPLEALSSEYWGLHWPMLEDEWTVPENVYYSLFAPCNLVRCALAGGDVKTALTCLRQAAAARATNARDEFLGEPHRRAFLLEWWRACLRILCAPDGADARARDR